jgi:hypothetical protein
LSSALQLVASLLERIDGLMAQIAGRERSLLAAANRQGCGDRDRAR